MINRLISSITDDQLSHLISTRTSYADVTVHELHHSERLLLNGSFEDSRKYFDEELPALRRLIEKLPKTGEIIVDLGYSMTMLYAAYYAVLHCANVTVNVLTPPAFGGDTRYAKSHPHVIQKLVYNVLTKADQIVLPTDDSMKAIVDVYPMMPDPIPYTRSQAAPLPDAFMPIYDYVRYGIAIFANFERGGGIDHAIQAWMKLLHLYPEQFKNRSVSVCGVGDHEQAGAIAVAFPDWKVALNPPISKMVELAGQAEVVVLPDDPPHAGPTKELFAAIGAGAAIVAHEGSAAGDYAGCGAVHFSAEGERSLMIANALLRAFSAPERTFKLMAATKERRDVLRSVNPVLHRPVTLDSPVEAGER